MEALNKAQSLHFLLYVFSLVCLIFGYVQTDRLNRIEARYDVLEKRLKAFESQDKTAQINTTVLKYE